MLLGLWASGGDASFSNEITALKAAIEQYGEQLSGLVDGISVGSEDLYRNSPMGIKAGSYVGAEPDTIARYIKETRDAIAGTPLKDAKIGHVETWTAWYNGSNQAVIDAVDWLGMDAYPYFQDTMPNAIGESNALFSDALGKTSQASGGKPVWITETGHPVSGKTVGQSVASVENAETFWKDVGCPLFGKTNIWWYTLQDAAPDTPNPSFGIVGNKLTTKPLFDLSCDDVPASASSAIASATAETSKPSGTAGSSVNASSGGSPNSENHKGGSSSGEDSGEESSHASSKESATVAPAPSNTYPSYPGATGGTGVPYPNPGTNGTYSTSGPNSPPAPSSTNNNGGGSPAESSPPPVGAGAGGLRSGAFSAAFLAVIAAVIVL